MCVPYIKYKVDYIRHLVIIHVFYSVTHSMNGFDVTCSQYLFALDSRVNLLQVWHILPNELPFIALTH